MFLFLFYQFSYSCGSRKSCYKAGHLPCNLYAPIGSPQNQVLIMNSIFTSHIVSTKIGKEKKKRLLACKNIEFRP